MPAYALGLDFGTESVRALVVDVRGGRVAGRAVKAYAHGVIDDQLPGGNAAGAGGITGRLPPNYALQHPGDWLASAANACRAALSAAAIDPAAVVGVGVDFTSCTLLPCRADGTPLCLLPPFAGVPLAWPKLWKHHAAQAEADRINAFARERREPWLDRYGGAIGLEWFFPKVLETARAAPDAYAAANVWLEAGDWFVWQLTSGPFPACDAGRLVRSTCQAGYKAMWNAQAGFPSTEFFTAVDPKLANVGAKLAGTLRAPGERAGGLTAAAAELLGLRPGTPVSAAIIDAHAGVPGAGVAEPGTLVCVIGTSACHMLMSPAEHLVPGVAGVVRDGILPGYYGYETGQAAVGDALAWLVETLGRSHEELSRAAADLPPGSGGVLAVDWLNGSRTPLMDGRLSGAFVGLTLGTTPAQLYRALIEGTAYGLRWIVDTLRGGGEPVGRFVAAGGLPGRSPLLMQVYADVLGAPLHLAESDQGVALGAAILGAVAAGQEVTGHATAADAVRAMARQRTDLVYRPDAEAHRRYQRLYRLYRELANADGTLAEVMRELREA